jgi:hypothetical protein
VNGTQRNDAAHPKRGPLGLGVVACGTRAIAVVGSFPPASGVHRLNGVLAGRPAAARFSLAVRLRAADRPCPAGSALAQHPSPRKRPTRYIQGCRRAAAG